MNRSSQSAIPSSGSRKPWHQKFRLLGWLHGKVRSYLFHFLERLVNNDEFKTLQVSTLRNTLCSRVEMGEGDFPVEAQPYANLGKAETRCRASSRGDVIIVTARFRSGSTLLWNLFRNLDGCTAYYEPFNERRWFDPGTRGNHTDPTHQKVEEYWREYEELEILRDYYQESWIDHDLFMDAQSWNPKMKRFIELLIDRASTRPVLQFNRIDFRLPWFRHHFPQAKIVHLYRHPRDQWTSTLVDPGNCPKTMTMVEFRQYDHYYLRNWSRDLKYYFPFLEEGLIEHPYQMFYYIWKLSYLFGRRYAHYSLAFENLISCPQDTLADLFSAVNVQTAHLDALQQLIEKPRADRWRDYAEEAWFRDQESRCEKVIGEFFGTGRGQSSEAGQSTRRGQPVCVPA